MNRKRKPFILLGSVFALFAVSPFLHFPWSRSNCTTQYIDIHSGRQRTVKYLYFFPVSRSFTHTPLSEVIYRGSVDDPAGDWRAANTTSPGYTHSPNYRYGQALYQANTVQDLWGRFAFTDEFKAETAKTIIGIWARSEHPRAASDYIDTLHDHLREPVSLKDLVALRPKA